jgi:hypothetical protein
MKPIPVTRAPNARPGEGSWGAGVSPARGAPAARLRIWRRPVAVWWGQDARTRRGRLACDSAAGLARPCPAAGGERRRQVGHEERRRRAGGTPAPQLPQVLAGGKGGRRRQTGTWLRACSACGRVASGTLAPRETDRVPSVQARRPRPNSLPSTMSSGSAASLIVPPAAGEVQCAAGPASGRRAPSVVADREDAAPAGSSPFTQGHELPLFRDGRLGDCALAPAILVSS